jgi:uncharacterized lipoprotein YmbA
MSIDRVFKLITVVLTFSLITLGGCARTQPTRFYTLHPLASSETEEIAAQTSEGLMLEIGPIEIPEYLDRPQIVTRAGENEFRLTEYNQWAESLKYSTTQILTENLSILLATDRVFLFPGSGAEKTDYQVAVEIIRFDGVPGGDVVLNARWSVFGGDEMKLLTKRRSRFNQPTNGKSYKALASAKSTILADFSREIATAIKTFSRETATP